MLFLPNRTCSTNKPQTHHHGLMILATSLPLTLNGLQCLLVGFVNATLDLLLSQLCTGVSCPLCVRGREREGEEKGVTGVGGKEGGSGEMG